MSDPFSVTGSAVGVISLGLTVCQGLISYYEAWNSQEQEVCSALNDLLAVTKALALVEARAKDGGAVSEEAIVHLQGVIMSTKEAVEELDHILSKCKKQAPISSVRQRIQSTSRGLLYPFRQATLQRLQRAVKGTQQNIALALQILQL